MPEQPGQPTRGSTCQVCHRPLEVGDHLACQPTQEIELTAEQAAAKERMIVSIKRGSIDDALKVAKEFRLPEDILTSPEVQFAAKEEMIVRLRDGDEIEVALKIAKEFRLPEDVLTSPEVQSAAKEGMIASIKHGYPDTALKIAKEFSLPESEVQSAARKVVIRRLRFGHIDSASAIAEKFHLPESEVQTAAKEGVIARLRDGEIEDALRIAKEFRLPEAEVQSAAKEGMINRFKSGHINDALKIAKEFRLPEDVLTSPEVQSAAKEGVITRLTYGQIDTALEIAKEFRLPEDILTSPDVQSAAKEGMVYWLINHDFDSAFKIAKEFRLPEAKVQSAAKEGMIYGLKHDQLDTALEIAKEFSVSEAEVKFVAKDVLSGYLQSEQAPDAGFLANFRSNFPDITPDTLAQDFPIAADAWRFFEDAKIPLAYRHDSDAYSAGLSPEARRARLTHALRPQEYVRIAELLPKNLELREGKPNWASVAEALEAFMQGSGQDTSIVDSFRLLRDTVGAEAAVRYANRPGLSRHDAFFFASKLVELSRRQSLSADRLARLMHEVARDAASFEEGTAHHRFAAIVQNLVEADTTDVIRRAAGTYQKIKTLQNLLADFKTAGVGPLDSWRSLKKFHDIYQLLGRSELLDELERGELSPKLRTFVEKLAFHPNIDMNTVFQFWKDPASFLEVDDSHTADQINAAKKPSNYLSLPYLGLRGEDLRDAYVEGELDDLQTLPAMERTYALYERAEDDPKNPRSLHAMLRRAIGSARLKIPGQGKDTKKLFHEVQKFCKAQGIAFADLWEENGPETIAALDEVSRQALQEILFDPKAGIKHPAGDLYRVRIGKKSDPEMVVAGNDTASCMPFGSGKNNVYMFNPNCVQLVLERQLAHGVWRTAAQSVVTIDIETSRLTPELIALYKQQNQHLKDMLMAEDFKRPPVVTCDNIEVAKNEEGRASTFIRMAYERFLREYLAAHAERLGIDPTRVIVGTGYTPAGLGLEGIPNTFVPLAPMGYSDNVHEQAMVIRTGLSALEAPRIPSGVAAMNTRDVIAVAVLEGKAYHDAVSLLENLHGMQNNIIGMEIANRHFGRPNLAFTYRDNKGVPRGYIMAYEGVNAGRPEVYLSDLAGDPESKLAGGRLIQAFFEAYVGNYGTAERPFLPIFTNAREKTSYHILTRQLEILASRAGLLSEMVTVAEYERNKELFYDVRIFLARTQDELEAQKTAYAATGQETDVRE